MDLEHSFTIPVPPQQAWQVLLDVEKVAPCMPGATIDSVEGDVIKGRIKVKVGPVTMTYAGTARFVERDEQALSVTLEASGKETRGSGTASATVRSSLQDEGGQTRVVVRTTMSVTGRPAQFGRGVMAEVGGRLIERFAANLADLLAGGGQAAASEPPPGESGGASQPGGATEPGGASQPGGAGEPASAEGTTTEATGRTASNGSASGGNTAGAASIEELGLPVRAYNSLRREGIRTVSDLSARSEQELLAMENLGPQSLKEIKQRLADRGFALAAAEPAPGPTGGQAAATDGAAPAQGRGPAAQAAAGAAPLRTGRPPDEDAIDLLSVAGFPVLKRVLPAFGALFAVLLIVLGARRRSRR
jgi:carbon monoxide dehydrogenase subunit G